MGNGITRRSWLKLIGGSAVGLMLTPVPWRVLDDSSKWTQSPSYPGSALREPIAGNERIDFKYTICTLCPMSCGIRLRCIDNHPVGLYGTPGHPISGGALCAMGLGAHLLPFHPSRLLQPYKRLKERGEVRIVPYSFDTVMKEICGAIAAAFDGGDGSIAVLDMCPDRSISSVYRYFLAGVPKGVYINPPCTEGLPMSAVRNALGRDETFGYDVENSRTILSFGTPVLDGWGTQGQCRIMADRRTGSGSEKLRVIQAESVRSRTARLADEWIPVRPGTEAAFALALANVIVKERLCDTDRLEKTSPDFGGASGHLFVHLAEKFPVETVSSRTGIPADRIIETAREIARTKPSVVVFGGDPGGGPFSPEEQAIFMNLNMLLGAVGSKGGLVQRNRLPDPFGRETRLASAVTLAGVPDHSVKVLIMDGAESGDAIPWPLIRRKLVTGRPIVVSLSPHLTGMARHADYIIPGPTSIESYDDRVTPPGAAAASYAICRPVTPAPAKAVEPLDFLKGVAASLQIDPDGSFHSISLQSIMRNRVEQIYRQQLGKVFDAPSGKTVPLTSVPSPKRLMDILSGGGCWLDDAPGDHFPRHYSFLSGQRENFERLLAAASKGAGSSTPVLIPHGRRGAESCGQTHPGMTKLYRESRLREPANVATINPSSGRHMNLTDGGKAVIETESGKAEVKVRFDAVVLPGIVEVTVGPPAGSFERAKPRSDRSVLEICKIEGDSEWRTTEAKITPA